MNDIQDLDQLISKLQEVRQNAGKNLPISVSFLDDNFCYHDKTLCNRIEIVKSPKGDFVELYI